MVSGLMFADDFVGISDTPDGLQKQKEKALEYTRKWRETAKHEGDKICKRFLCNIWKKRSEHRTVEGVSIRSRNGAPSRKEHVVNDQTTKASNK